MFTLTDHGGAPSESCLGALEEIIYRLRAEVRLHQARVDVHPPWDYHAPVGFDHLDTAWNDQLLPHLPAKETCRQNKL